MYVRLGARFGLFYIYQMPIQEGMRKFVTQQIDEITQVNIKHTKYKLKQLSLIQNLKLKVLQAINLIQSD